MGVGIDINQREKEREGETGGVKIEKEDIQMLQKRD